MTKLHDDEKEFHHESYVLAGFSRISGNVGRLFGSSLSSQHTVIRFRVTPGMRRHSLSQDWYSEDRSFNDGRGYVEVDFSPAQFAELLTTMNIGSGVPCTLRYLNNHRVEDPPEELLEAEQIKVDFAETTDGLTKRMKRFESLMGEVFDKKTAITQKDKKALQDAYAMVVQQVQHNMPFVIEQFHRAATKIVTQAKVEVDAFMLHAVLAAGVKAIQEGGTQATMSLLENGKVWTCCGHVHTKRYCGFEEDEAVCACDTPSFDSRINP